MTVYTILIVIAMLLFIAALVKRDWWPLPAVGGLLVCVVLLAGKHLVT